MTYENEILEGLNERQREAVAADTRPLLITAGAGSGKTLVLVRRIAWLIKARNIPRNQIMAVTFTNKAAREMRERVENRLGTYNAPSRMGTFHGLSNLFLRINFEAAGLNRDFTIIDSADQRSIIKRIIENSDVRAGDMKPQQIQALINQWKEQQLRFSNVVPIGNYQKTGRAVYELYEKHCNKNDLVDFAELLLRAVEVMQRNQIIREENQKWFEHVLVDEFQDTNHLQLEWLKLFCGSKKKITAVGDEDQSIYEWRGAIAENMLQFTEYFPNTQIVRLEQNYRSTQTILDAANSVIKNNVNRYKKNLWTSQGRGDLIKIYEAANETEEAKFVASKLKELAASGTSFSNMAILYRTNAQSRVFEDTLAFANIPFRIYGGLRFFERKEIKDALAYMRLIIDPHNADAFLRVINFPNRGIGAVSLNHIVNFANSHQISLWQASENIVKGFTSTVPNRVQSTLRKFVNLIQNLQKNCERAPFPSIARRCIEDTGLVKHFDRSKLDLDVSRVENLYELINAATNFIERSHHEDNIGAIRPFLDAVTLDADDNYEEAQQDKVQLMTLHLAKGLEFPVVFIVGVGEDILPHVLSVKDGGRDSDADSNPRLLEERRLFYVGITRAQNKLFLTTANSRQAYGNFRQYRPSRFLSEIPRECLDSLNSTARARTRKNRSTIFSPKISSANLKFKPKKPKNTFPFLGKTVTHRAFGEGTVTGLQYQGKMPLVTVNFRKSGPKLIAWRQHEFKILD